MDNRGINSGSNSYLSPSGNFLAGLPPREEFEKLIECPICQDLPQPPIYLCQTGHTICSKCKVIMKRCPICTKRFTTSRNFLLESIVQDSDYFCSRRDQGCDVTGSSLMLKDHDGKCKFRPAKCFLGGLDGCKGELILLPEYLHHLINRHQVHKIYSIPTEENQNVFTKGYFFSDWGNAIWNKDSYTSWPKYWFSFDDKFFITRIIERRSKFFFQLAIIADTTDDNDAKYTAKVFIETKQNQYPKYQLQPFEVPSIREFHDDGESLREKDFGAVSKELMESLGLRVAMEEKDQFQLIWFVRYELSKM